MNTEDEEFNRIERESKQRMESVRFNLQRAKAEDDLVHKFKLLVWEFRNTPLSFKNAERKRIVSEIDEELKKL